MIPDRGTGTAPAPAARRRFSLPALAAAAALLLVGAGSFLLRVEPLRGFPAVDGLRPLVDPDCYYHLRVARLVAERFPAVPRFDSYLNYPAGAEIPLPPLQGLLAAAIARALPGPLPRNLDAVAHYYPVAVGCLAVVLVFPLARLAGLGRAAALLAALLSSLVPVQYFYTVAGRFDHHAGDLLFTLIAFLLYLALWRQRERRPADPLALAGVAGLALALALMILNFLGSILYAAILVAVSCLAAALDRGRDPGLPRFLGRAAAAFVAAAGLCALFTAAAYGGGRLLSLAYDRVSGFQPLLLAAAGLAHLLPRDLLRHRSGALRRPLFPAAALLLLLAALLLAAESRAGYSRYLTRAIETMSGVSENVSPFFLPVGRGPAALSLAQGAQSLTYAWLLAPVAVLWLLLRALRGARGPALPEIFLAAWIAVHAVLAAFQVRHGIIFSAAIAIGAAWVAERLWTAGRGPGLSPPRRAAALLALPLCAAVFYPGPVVIRRVLRHPAGLILNQDAAATLAWIARNTPDPGGYDDPGRRPAYGVLAPWELGHEIIGRARRPAIATGFLDTLPGGHFLDAQRFFVEEDAGRAREFMERNSLRYLVLRSLPETLGRSYRILGLADEGRAVLGGLSRGSLPPRGGPVALRLWLRRGAAGPALGAQAEGTRHFRLLRESYSRNAWTGALEPTQIYEFVPGARITGRALPGEQVTAVVPLRTGGGNRLDYAEVARAGADGAFELTIPYATELPNGETYPLGPVWVTAAASGRGASVRVSEAQVRSGEALAVAFASPP